MDFQGDAVNEMRVTVALGEAPTHVLNFVLESEMARPSAAGSSPRVAIIIEEAEADLKASRELLSLPGPFTFSVASAEMAREIYQKGHEVLLRLPLESLGTTKEETQEKLRAALRAVPNVKGVSAPLSSTFVEDPARTVLILKEIKEAGLYFIERGQTRESVAYFLARSLGVKAAERNVILDSMKEREAMYQQLVKLSHLALKEGWATAVVRPNPVTASLLKDNIPRLKERGFELVPLSRVAK